MRMYRLPHVNRVNQINSAAAARGPYSIPKGLPYGGGGTHLELQMDWHRERTTMAYEMNVHLHH